MSQAMLSRRGWASPHAGSQGSCLNQRTHSRMSGPNICSAVHTHPAACSRRQMKATCQAAVQGRAYRQPGQYRTHEVNPITIRVGGDDELPITAQIMVTLPIGAPCPAPLVLISAGFLINASMYMSYAADLASWGYAVAMYDVNEVMDDTGMVNAIQLILNTCQGGDPQLRSLIDPAGVALIGHSRGAKLSCLAAARLPAGRVRGLMLLDPVDNTPMTPAGEGYPSALPALASISGPPNNLPVMIIGAGSGGDVVPDSANFKRFLAASRGPTWCVELTGAGHLSFLDKQIALFSLFSASGSTSDDLVRAASKVAILTWLQHACYPLRGASCSLAVLAADAEIKMMTRNEAVATNARLSLVQGNPGPAAQEAPRSSSTQAAKQYPPITDTYEQLMKRRAKELKAILVERNIKCDDIFEKEQLARRIVELSCS